MKFNEWVNLQRGRSLEIAQAIGVTPPVVSDWTSEKKQIPPRRCVQIEQFTHRLVTRQEMRPHDYLEHWPELAQANASIAQAATDSVATSGQGA